MSRLLLIAIASVSLGACAHPESRANQIADWNSSHPEAARGLCVWVQRHPQASHQFFEWDAHHPERSLEFVTWTIDHPRQGIDAFVVDHPNWPGFNRINESHRPAAQSFMDWVRRYPEAAQRLMTQSGGLAWAGNHLAC